MKTNLYRNIDLVQIDVKSGIENYSFPKNVTWADEIVDQIIICTPTSSACVSPIDRVTPVLTAEAVRNLYLDIYDSDENEVAHNMQATNLLHTNNHPLPFGRKLNLQLTRLFFTEAPTADGCLLVYIFYRTKFSEVTDPCRRNKCVTFDLGADERITFGDVCRRYLHASGETVRGLWFVNPEENPAYLTLRDHDLTYYMYNVHNELMRGLMAGETAEQCQVRPFRMDCLDIDFEYSYIQNATATPQTHNIIIEY